jgi:putative hydrolase of the HAD superfamily
MEAEDSARSVKTLWIREPYLAQILAGRKTVEVRVAYENIRRLQAGDQLKLNDKDLATICRISRYTSFEELLHHEDPGAIAPDLAPDELLLTLRQIYPPDKEALGVVALEFEVAHRSVADTDRRRYQAVLFDMGYTLVYFEPPQEVIAQRALRSVGAERSVDEIMAAVQVVYGEYYRDADTTAFPATEEHDRSTQLTLERALLAHLGIEAGEQVQQSFRAATEAWYNRPRVIRPYAEVEGVISALTQAGYRLGIISNWSWNLRNRVRQTGLEGYFELVWASAYAGCNKPHPAIFDQALAQMRLSQDRVLYVGDSYQHDVVGARNAGLDVVLLDRDGATEHDDCPVIRDLWGLFDLLDS